MDHLKEAQEALELAAKFMDDGNPSEADYRMRAAIAHALIAIAERLPVPREWHCCNCEHDWWEAAVDYPVCPHCGEKEDTFVPGRCASCYRQDSCKKKAQTN